MELRHLRYVFAVAEEQNVTRAATRLHVSQSPLSRQIRDLESELGVALFDHGAKSVRLTEAGRVFLVEARAVIQRVDQAVQAVKAVASGKKGEIHVGYAPSLTVEILPRALRFFHESNAGIVVRLHDLSTREMLSGLRDGKLQVALLIQLPSTAMGGLKFEELSRYPVCIAVHPAHPLAKARKIGLENLVKERLIVYTLADYPEYHSWLSELFAPLKQQPAIAEEHDSSTSLIASVEAGHGIALVPQGFDCLAGPRLKVRPISPPPAPLIAGAAYRADSHSAVTQQFVAAARRSI
jgi:DNA-binding transcriptional LysR family regulator